MKKILFIIIILSFNGKAINYTNDIYQKESIINCSVAVVGDENEELGYGVSGGGDLNLDGFTDMAGIGKFGMRLFYGTNHISSKIVNFDSTNSFLFSKTDSYLYNEAAFVHDDSKTIGIVTSGPIVTNEGVPVRQVDFIRAASQLVPVTNYAQINGTNGFRIVGTSNITYIAYDIIACKDMNGDGLDEFMHRRRDGYLWYGNTNIGQGVLYVDEINGTNGMEITSYYGQGAASGDFNGDGRGDISVNTTEGLSIIYGRQRFIKTISATNLPPEDGVVIKNASIGKNGGFGDINGDGIDDIIMPGGIVMFGRTNWETNPDAKTMGLGEIMHPTSSVASVFFGGFYRGGKTAVIGDLNGDGFDDWAIAAIQEIQIHPPIQSNKFLIVYGKPIYPVNMEMWLLDSTNGFAITDSWILSHTRGGDWNNDGYEEAILGMPWEADHRGIVTITPGGPSPAWSPYIFTPELIMEGRSNMFASTVLTNMVTGRKGKRHMVLSDGPEPIEQEWLGTWFTTKVIRTTIDETRTVNYWTTNILGRSKPATTLVINAVPEPGMIIAGMIIVIGIVTARKNRS